MKSGILLIDKPKGITSRDVVNVLCKRFNTRKIGHTGTLDPLATGLMIVCVNKATSLVEVITSEDKEYIATVKVGILTDTLDVTGNILSIADNYKLEYDKLDETLKSFIGSYWQEVPAYSAVKVNGKRLYEYARDNEPVLLPKRLVDIKEIKLIEVSDETFSFKVKVSKGTYIRSLIRDIGNKMNISMVLQDLRRTKIDDFNVLNAKKLEDIILDDLIPIENFMKIPKIYVDDMLEKKIVNGVKLPNIYNSEMVMFINNENKLLAIYKKNDKNMMCMFKLF